MSDYLFSRILSHQQQSYCLRHMLESDLDQVLSIEQSAQAHPWSASQFRSSLASSHQCYVLEKKQSIAAYAITSTAADEAELLNITVSPQVQRQGLGSLLLAAFCDIFDETIHTLFLEVRASNAAAIHLYDNHMFNQVGLRKNYYPAMNGQREDAIIMAKWLKL